MKDWRLLRYLGRSIHRENHALVFIWRGVSRPWEQVLAYYFTAGTITTQNFKKLIVQLISQMQSIGLNVIPTICDHGATNKSAVTQLCAEANQTNNQFYFLVNNEPVTVLFDIPHLLKNTRNALLTFTLEMSGGKFVKFE